MAALAGGTCRSSEDELWLPSRQAAAAAADRLGPVLHGCALPVRQLYLQQHHQTHRAEPGVGAQLHLCALLCGPLLLPGLQAAALEAARASMHSIGSCGH
jgi:hypothetical protein